MDDILYANKVENGGIPPEGVVSAADMNEIKNAVNVNAAEAEARLAQLESDGVIFTSEADMLPFDTGAKYTLPEDHYFFNFDASALTKPCEFSTNNGVYKISSDLFRSIGHNSALPLFTEAAGVSNIILISADMFWQNPSGEVFNFTNPNSIILRLPAFANCQKVGTITGAGFCTFEDIAIIACADGFTLTGFGIFTGQLLQWSDSPDMNGVAYRIDGSGIANVMQIDSRGAASDAFWDIENTFVGQLTAVGGNHDPIAQYFKTGGLNENSVNVFNEAVFNTAPTQARLGAYILAVDEVPTIVENGNFTPVLAGAGDFQVDIANAFTVGADGKVTYMRNEPRIVTVIWGGGIDISSSNNQMYNLYLELTKFIGTEVSLIEQARTPMILDSADDPTTFKVVATFQIKKSDFFYMGQVGDPSVQSLLYTGLSIQIF